MKRAPLTFVARGALARSHSSFNSNTHIWFITILISIIYFY